MNTSTTTLTDRYVAAAIRTVPEDQRADIAAELRASIDDQVDARVDEGEPREFAERAVLTDLGDPDKLAAGYMDRPLYLIGPRYYLDWWRLLKLLLWIVLPCAAFGIALGQTIAGEPFGKIVGTVVVALITTTVHLFFWTTLVFVIVERTGADKGKDLTGEWSVDKLPEPRERGVGFADMIASLVWLLVAAGAIVWDQTIGFGGWGVDAAPFLNPGLWPWWIAGLFVLMLIEASLRVIVYLVGRWTIPLAVANALLGLAVAVPAIILLMNGQLLNPEFFPSVIPDQDSAAEVTAIVGILTGFGIAGITLWDIIDVFLKARRSRSTGR